MYDYKSKGNREYKMGVFAFWGVYVGKYWDLTENHLR